MKSINPYTLKEVGSYNLHKPQEVRSIIETSHKAFNDWQQISISERSKYLLKLAEILFKNKELYASCMTDEMGKVIREARAEIEKCASACKYYAKNSEQFLQDEIIKTEASKSYVTYRPLGVILAVMPWNFPFWQVFRFAIPALLAGNGFVLKHAANVTSCSLLIEQCFKEAGFPENLVRSLIIDSKDVAQIIANPLIKAVTLTGSTGAGRAVAAKAGEYLKKSVLELGGSDPYIILEDADIDCAATICAKSRLINAGQSCISAKRFIVVESVYNEFLAKFKASMEKAIIGDPEAEATSYGPLASLFLRDTLHRQVLKSVDKGARLVCGGFVPDMPGAFYPPTILAEVEPRMPAYEEELFGPVASVIKARDEAQAIRIANDSVYGLGAGIFTRDLAKGEHIARNLLEAGSCFVNEYVRSDPRLPFGGVKESGYGRELALYGLLEFVNVKSVYVK